MSKKNSANTLGTEMSNTEMLNNIFEKLEASDGTDLDVKEIERQLDILQERAPIELPDDIQEESLKELLEEQPEHAKKENKGNGKKINARKILSIIGIAAALAIVLTVVAGAVGFGPVVKLVDDVVQIVSVPSGDLRINDMEDCEYHTLREALDDNGMEDALCITWIPKGFSLSSVSVKETASFSRVTARYFGENQIISIVIKDYKNENYSETVEAEENDDNETVESYNGVEYHISNNGNEISAWTFNNGFYYDIHGNITIEEMNRILNRII